MRLPLAVTLFRNSLFCTLLTMFSGKQNIDILHVVRKCILAVVLLGVQGQLDDVRKFITGSSWPIVCKWDSFNQFQMEGKPFVRYEIDLPGFNSV